MMLATALCEFDMILRRNAKVIPMDMEEFPAPIQYYRMYMEELKTAVDLDKKELKKATEKIGKQKGFMRSQDNIDLSKLSIESFDVGLCSSAHCRHRCLLPT